MLAMGILITGTIFLLVALVILFAIAFTLLAFAAGLVGLALVVARSLCRTRTSLSTMDSHSPKNSQ